MTDPAYSTRWYFATVEHRRTWLQQRLSLAIHAGASEGAIRTIKRGILRASVPAAPESSQPS